MPEPLKCPHCTNSSFVWMHPSQTTFHCPNCLQSFEATVVYPPLPSPRRVPCIACGKKISARASHCFSCGVSQAVITPEILALRQRAELRNSKKSRHVYLKLALTLGFIGAHNFYAGHLLRAIPQLLLTLLFYWTLWVPLIIWGSALVEAFACSHDAEGKVLV